MADPGACLSPSQPPFFTNPNCHPFFWDDGNLIDLNTETIGGSPITAQAINDVGQVVGNAAFPLFPMEHPGERRISGRMVSSLISGLCQAAATARRLPLTSEVRSWGSR